MSNTIKTNISQAHWCNKGGAFEPAKSEILSGNHQICWLDRLFEGGLVLPEPENGKPRALTILLTGPVGTGKSTLALELCTRWSAMPQAGIDNTGLNSLYITAETNHQWPLQKAKDLKWKAIGNIRRYDDPPPTDVPSARYVWIDTTCKFIDFFRIKPHWLLSNVGTEALKLALNKVAAPNVTDATVDLFKKELEADAHERTRNGFKKTIEERALDILVIDSLNSIATPEGKNEVLAQFSTLVNNTRLKIIIAILESSDPTLEQWPYAFDTVIRLDMVDVSGVGASKYLLRTLEIKKARYQSHVWGIHQLKFSKPPEDPPSGETTSFLRLSQRRRAHPYCNEGGIFIFPSIPYHLSLYKRLCPDLPTGRFSTGINELDEFLKAEPHEEGGFPDRRCTGFIGTRGGHKSHLGYLSVLNHITSEPKAERGERRALIVSLRDDEDMARKALSKILSETAPAQNQRTTLNNEDRLKQLEADDRLELQFFPPGHIAPEEFYHRILMSVLRLKRENGDVVLLFNSLDQLASRFPLCAKDEIFIPALIETLNANNVTSIFIGVEEDGQPSQQYGLLSMADALLSFRRIRISKRDYIGHIMEAMISRGKSKSEAKGYGKELSKHEYAYPRPVVLEIVRFAGGQAAKTGGILELIHESRHNDRDSHPDNNQLWGKKEGLCFVKFSPEYRRRVDTND